MLLSVPVDIRYRLLQRYVDMSLRNGRLGVLSFALMLFGVAYEAPLGPRLVALFTLWGILVVRGWLSRRLLYAVIYGAFIALAVLSVSYLSAYPASVMFVLVSVSPLVVFMFLHGRREEVTVCMVDADRFKRVNDSHGHPVGDEVPRSVAGLLGTRLRDGDCLARYGGEEFLVILRRCNASRGKRVAEALRHNVASGRDRVEVHIADQSRLLTQTPDSTVPGALA